jgi:hypothetical protein
VASVHLRQDHPHLGFGQDHLYPRRALRVLDVVQPFELLPEDLFLEEHDSAKRLIFGRSRYVSLDRKVGQEALDLGFAHGVRMALPMEQDEPGLQGCNAFRRYSMNRIIQST